MTGMTGTTHGADDGGGPAPVIGLFDSGWGGLSVAMTVRAAAPHADLLYVGDHAHCPYGGRAEAAIVARALALTGWLAERGADIAVIACNTASALALTAVREAHPGRAVVGVVPAVKPAARMTRTGVIAVLATPATAGSAYLAGLTRDHAAGVRTLIVAAPGLVELVESGVTGGEEPERAIRALLAAPLAAGTDAIVLGCTHYPFLRGAVAAVAGPGVAVIDSGLAIGRRVRDLLGDAAGDRGGGSPGSLRLCTTGDPASVAPVAARLLGERLPVEAIEC
ncbi:MAG: glutamate racemase [Chloroflexota bacterium]